MRRIKVVSEPTDLVPILRAFDSDVKREVFKLLIEEWVSTSAIREEFGDEGVKALQFFEKTKLVETRWEAVEGGTEKAYHSYYTTFNINTSCPVNEISEILNVAAMSNADYATVEEEIAAIVGRDGSSARVIAEKLGIQPVRVKSLVKRSPTLEIKGQMVKRVD